MISSVFNEINLIKMNEKQIIELIKFTQMIKGFKIVKSSEIYNELVSYAKNGATRGKYLGFPEFHKYYSMALGVTTDWTGIPQSGKTQVLMECLLNTSEWYGWKHLVYFPDVGDAKEILADLIHKRSGKTFDKRYKNHITDFEISAHSDWICEHFFILTKEDLKSQLSPIEFWDMGVEMSLNIQGGLQTMSVDSWKDLKHDTSSFGRDDKYLEYVLSYRNAIAEKYNMHINIVIHPTRTDKDEKGKRKPPSPYHLKGGTEWFNNGKCMITVHRPDGSKNEVHIMVTKAKPRSVAKRGVYKAYFDLEKFRYYNWINGEKRYAEQKSIEEIEELEREYESDVDSIGTLENNQKNQSIVSNIETEDDDLPF